jgi:IS605 OrfB family transposase
MQRTIKFQLNTNPEQEHILRETLQGFTWAFNFVCDYGWKHHEKNGVTLHHETYPQIRLSQGSLPSQLVCAARVKATEALKSSFTRLKLGKKASQPKSNLCPIRYDQRSYWVNWDTLQTSLATTQGRQLIGFTVPQYAQKYTGYPVDSADLIYRKGKFWLHVVVTLPDSAFIPADSGETIGVDLGLNHPAVTSKRKFLGSKHWKEVDRRTFRLKRKLQSKGTKSAKRHLKRLAGRLTRFRRDCDHVLSKRIVQSVTSGTTIVIENLTDIRTTSKIGGKKTKRRLHSWSFAQFRSFLNYKAEFALMKVVAIDPRHTSQTCSKCGFQSRSNRKSQSKFLCKKCAYQLNADLNAAYNIRDKHLATLGISLGSGSQSIGLSSPSSDEGQATAL